MPAILACSASFDAGPRRFRVTLTRARSAADFTLGIKRADGSGMHLVHLCDHTGGSGSMRNPRLGLYGEVHDIGDAKLFVIALLDVEPCALRIALVEPQSQRVFQLVVLDAEVGPSAVPFPDASPARGEVLQTYSSSFALPPLTPVVTKSATAGLEANAKKASRIIHRVTRRLPSGQPVLISVVREMLPDKSIRFRVLMYHPVTAREMQLVLASPFPDRILAACGLGTSRTVTAEAVDAARNEVSAQILPFVFVHPDGAEIEFHPEVPEKSSGEVR